MIKVGNSSLDLRLHVDVRRFVHAFCLMVGTPGWPVWTLPFSEGALDCPITFVDQSILISILLHICHLCELSIKPKYREIINEPPHEKPIICICENKDTDQLRGNREADQRLCFRYTDSTIPLLLQSEILSF